MLMALPGWCTKVFGTRTVEKAILLIVLLVITSVAGIAATAAKPVSLSVDGEVQALTTQAKTVGAVLAEAGLYARSCDVLTPQADKKVTHDMKISLVRAVPVYLKVDKQNRLVYTTSATTAEFLTEQQVELAETDCLSPAGVSCLDNGSTVQVIRMTTDLVQEETEIPFKTTQKKDPKLASGRKTVQVEGKPGMLEKTYQVVYADGVEESRELVEEKRLIEPVNCVLAIGTKPVPVIASRNGTTGRVYEGMASYYADKFAGRKTAYGDAYNPEAYTAAFPDKALRGKKLRVTYLKTGRSVEVLVNDFGPHTKGRLVDLSAAAARKIGLLSAGVGKVKVEVLK
ncbi:MAG TPA: septal ring lytic transglycosylase RlpA family protein [Oscillospiraceae bacterium]|nr:septal ring lytic transglycosylase RlpA family protein [Oscillospiraceae bacterium]